MSGTVVASDPTGSDPGKIASDIAGLTSVIVGKKSSGISVVISGGAASEGGSSVMTGIKSVGSVVITGGEGGSSVMAGVKSVVSVVLTGLYGSSTVVAAVVGVAATIPSAKNRDKAKNPPGRVSDRSWNSPLKPAEAGKNSANGSREGTIGVVKVAGDGT